MKWTIKVTRPAHMPNKLNQLKWAQTWLRVGIPFSNINAVICRKIDQKSIRSRTFIRATNSSIPGDHHRIKNLSARFPSTHKRRSIDDFDRLPEEKHLELMANSRLTNENPMNMSPGLTSGFGSNLHYLFHRRQRGEKRSIPEEQKDEKYFERRKRNNEAAKKSRDARKIREDRVSIAHIYLPGIRHLQTIQQHT